MSTAQRSKTGCWSCRLRRKKCNEGGPPCSNCESRGVFCHGYGPKPPWKDRGEKEREEANRLQLQSRIRRNRSKTLYSSISQLSSTSGASIDVTTPDVQSPVQADFSLSPLSPPQERHVFEFLDNLELAHGSWDAPSFSNDLWPSSSSAESLVGLTDFQPPTRDLRPSPALGFPSVAAAQGPGVGGREVELVMHFIGETFPLQHTSYRAASTIQRSWLLFLLMRSPTFYYASLSMSAYHYFLTLSGDSTARRDTFQDYQKYRACALRGFCELLESDRPLSSGSLLGECMICGVQIALLEVRMIYAFFLRCIYRPLSNDY
jgi:C6 transcription factor Pro1